MTPPRTDPPTKHRLRLHREMLAALASGLVGALALATSTYNVYLQRQQVRAAVWPRMAVGAGHSDDGFSVSVTNRGVGPAEVKRVRVAVDGKPAEDWLDAQAMLLHERRLFASSWFDAVEGQVFSPGLSIVAFRVAHEPEARRLLVESSRLSMEVCYCSTLDECWVTRTASMHDPSVTEPTSTCVPDAHPFVTAGARTLSEMAGVVEKLRAPDAGDADAQAR